MVNRNDGCFFLQCTNFYVSGKELKRVVIIDHNYGVRVDYNFVKYLEGHDSFPLSFSFWKLVLIFFFLLWIIL
jgi:hypothetical protein